MPYCGVNGLINAGNIMDDKRKLRCQLFIAKLVKCEINDRFYHTPYERCKAGEIELSNFLEAGILPRKGESLLFYNSMSVNGEVVIEYVSYKYEGIGDGRYPVIMLIGIEKHDADNKLLHCPAGCNKCGKQYTRYDSAS